MNAHPTAGPLHPTQPSHPSHPLHPLHGRAILVTRPAAQAAPLCQLIASAGGEAVAFPTVEILSIWSNSQGTSLLSISNLITFDVAVFVSPTAVAQGLAALEAGGTTATQWPPHLAVAALGPGTVAALARRGFTNIIAPTDGADSEALAALPEFQSAALADKSRPQSAALVGKSEPQPVAPLSEFKRQPAAAAAKSVLIVSGEGGREWLADTLRARGARVEVAECYRRVVPQADAAPLAVLWKAGGVAAVAVYSRGAFDNLLAMLPVEARPLVLATPLFAAHPRIAAHALESGAREVLVAGPGDDEMIAGMQAFFAKVTP